MIVSFALGAFFMGLLTSFGYIKATSNLRKKLINLQSDLCNLELDLNIHKNMMVYPKREYYVRENKFNNITVERVQRIGKK